jgi:hypothetical protein
MVRTIWSNRTAVQGLFQTFSGARGVLASARRLVLRIFFAFIFLYFWLEIVDQLDKAPVSKAFQRSTQTEMRAGPSDQLVK